MYPANKNEDLIFLLLLLPLKFEKGVNLSIVGGGRGWMTVLRHAGPVATHVKSSYLVIWPSIDANSKTCCTKFVCTLTRLAVSSRIRRPEQVDTLTGWSHVAGHDLLPCRAGCCSISDKSWVPDFVTGRVNKAAVGHAGCSCGLPALAGGGIDRSGVAVRVGIAHLGVADSAGIEGIVERAWDAEHPASKTGNRSSNIHFKNMLQKMLCIDRVRINHQT